MSRRLLVDVLGTMRQGAFTPALPGLGVLLGPAPILFGSAPGADEAHCPVTLRHPTVSRRHARAALEGDAWTIRDLDSDNGLTLFAEGMDFASPADAAFRTGCPLPVAFAAYDAEPVAAARIDRPRTLALGGVVLRLTPVGEDGGAA
jgi:hypothetical protein